MLVMQFFNKLYTLFHVPSAANYKYFEILDYANNHDNGIETKWISYMKNVFDNYGLICGMIMFNIIMHSLR